MNARVEMAQLKKRVSEMTIHARRESFSNAKHGLVTLNFIFRQSYTRKWLAYTKLSREKEFDQLIGISYFCSSAHARMNVASAVHGFPDSLPVDDVVALAHAVALESIQLKSSESSKYTNESSEYSHQSQFDFSHQILSESTFIEKI